MRDKTWLFMVDTAHRGAYNMALDEQLAVRAGEGVHPVLRIYRFEPTTVTVGRFQDASGELNIDACRSSGIDVVRRPTGGKAILHLDDFTYSVSLPLEQDKLNREELFNTVSKGIIEALDLLEIKAELVSYLHSDQPGSAWCFSSEYGVDIEYRGRKICGSAQRILSSSALQHGSLFLRPNPEIMSRITDLRIPGDQLSGAFIDLEEASGRTISWMDVAEAFRGGFERALGVALVDWEPDEELCEAAVKLAAEKYLNLDWMAGASGR